MPDPGLHPDVTAMAFLLGTWTVGVPPGVHLQGRLRRVEVADAR